MIQIYDGKKDIDKIESILTRSQMDSKDVLLRVDEILEEVRIRGDEAVLDFTRMYDQNDLNTLKVSREEIDQAKDNIDEDLRNAIINAIDNITAFHKRQVREDFFMAEGEDILLGQLISPIERVGIYIPGGTASYPSTVMMNAIPAKIAGVDEIIMVTPADKDGKIRDSVLVAADLIGVSEIYKVGGAQAIGALCFGTETIPKVDKIVGPGNIYVAMAKRKVSGIVGIDMIAGPSEVVILAEDGANPTYIAADLIAQAEHDMRAAAIVVTNSYSLAEKIQKETLIQLLTLNRSKIAEKSLTDFGAIIITEDREEMFQIANRLAPEHLEILTKDYLNDFKKIRNAGAIFLGEYTPEPVGDYYAGPNHTLPTSRTARFSSPLGVDDFCKKTSLLYYSKDALIKASRDIMNIATDEGLTGHANSIRVRTEE
ncbi:histidinol dehydrogenase [Tissierella creatinini]|nr:histidinol dehydrogenase [Tissierella creatinini]TJX66747.1 histidinol dehydrogenase [Soehngenia saccharolytica]